MSIELSKLLNTTPETLAKAQHDALKQHVITVLENVAELIQSEEYDRVETMLEMSAAGDGHGDDNWFINFKWSNDGSGAWDINDVCAKLLKLKNQAKN